MNILLRSLYYSRTLGAQFNYVFIIRSHIQSVLMRHDHIIMELLTFTQSGIDFSVALTVTGCILALNWWILIYTVWILHISVGLYLMRCTLNFSLFLSFMVNIGYLIVYAFFFFYIHLDYLCYHFHAHLKLIFKKKYFFLFNKFR